MHSGCTLRSRCASWVNLTLAAAAAVNSVIMLLTPSSASASPLGVNVDPNVDWSTDMVWTDLAHDFRSWGPADAPWQTPTTSIPMSADGYPLQDAGAYNSANNYPNGVYKVSYTGSGNLTFGSSTTILSNVVRVGNTTTADLTINRPSTSQGGIWFKVSGVDVNNPIDNLHILMPGTRPGQAFTDEFVRRLAPFTTLRFMDWGATNGSPVANWTDRTTPQQFVQTGNAGVAMEYQISLANQAKKDPWITIPDQASDDYIRQEARLIHQQLDPSRTLYVEYSNEVWNPRFPQYARNVANAAANPLLTAASNDVTARAGQEAAYMTKRVGDIFRQEFGAADANRLKVVFGGQAASTYYLDNGLKFLKNTYGDPSQYINGLAIAPYLNIDPSVDVPGLTMDGLFTSLNRALDNDVTTWIKKYAAESGTFHIPLVAYEGGQGLVSYVGNAGLVNDALKQAAQRDPRMGAILTRLLNIWNQNGGTLFNNYSYVGAESQWGSWGLLENITDAGTVKYDAILRMTMALGDVNLDGTVDHVDLSIISSHLGQNTNIWWEQGDLNGDRRVSADDLALYNLGLAMQSSVSAAKASTPEPAGSMVVIGGAATRLLGRRRRRRI